MENVENSCTVEPLLTNSQIKDTIEKTSIIRTKLLVPTGLVNTFFTSERGKPLYYSKNWPKILGPKMSIIERFHCFLQLFLAITTCTENVPFLANSLQELYSLGIIGQPWQKQIESYNVI